MLTTFKLRDPRSALAEQVKGHVGALLLVALSSMIGLPIAERWGAGPVVLLYIPPVLAAAVYAGLLPALLAAVAGTLAYNFYFTAPLRTFMIHSPADAVTVVILFVVALVTSRLAGSLRDQARLAEAHATRNATIAGFARKLLSRTDEAEIAVVAVEELSRLFDCNAVVVAGRDDPRIVASAPGAAPLAPSDLAAAAVVLDVGQPAGRGLQRLHLADWQFHPIASAAAVLAAAGIARDDGLPPVPEEQAALLGNLLDQVALALERARLEQEARESVRLRERDKLRSALLASIGEDVKPRLNAIGAAARALRREGAGDKALVGTVAQEVVKLDRYIDNLVELEPGAEQEPIRVGSLEIDLYRRIVRRADTEIHLTPKEFALLAELARHSGRVLTHAHLLRVVWGPSQDDQIDYLRVAVRALRQKLEADPAHPALIVNEPAVGYRMVPLPPE